MGSEIVNKQRKYGMIHEKIKRAQMKASKFKGTVSIGLCISLQSHSPVH